MARVLDPASDSALIVACSHGILFGPVAGITTREEFRRQIGHFSEGGATGLMLTPGYLRTCADLLLGPGKPAPIFSLSWSDIWRSPEMLGHEGFKHSHTLIASVEDAVRAGADMVHVYVHYGSRDPEHDAAEMKRLGEVVSAGERFGVPVICEPLARGTAVEPGKSNKKEYVALVARMAAEIGADMVKIEYTGDQESFAEAVSGCAVPVVVMGGAKTNRYVDFLSMVEEAMAAGAKGVAVGRNIFLHPDPTAAMKALGRVVKERVPAVVAVEEVEAKRSEALTV